MPLRRNKRFSCLSLAKKLQGVDSIFSAIENYGTIHVENLRVRLHSYLLLNFERYLNLRCFSFLGSIFLCEMLTVHLRSQETTFINFERAPQHSSRSGHQLCSNMRRHAVGSPKAKQIWFISQNPTSESMIVCPVAISRSSC